MSAKTSGAKLSKAKKAAKVRKARVGQEVLAGLKEALAHQRGDHVPGLVVRKPVDVKAIRAKTGLSQDKFAERFGIPAPTIRAWELNQRQPDRAAQNYLRVIEHEPDAVERALKNAS